jgi:hypothetical protein
VVLPAVPSLGGVRGEDRLWHERQPKSVRYEDLNKVCEHYFGPPRTTGGSHAVFKTPWPGDPRVNIQNDKGKAKPYQVRQVLAAIDKKEAQ